MLTKKAQAAIREYNCYLDSNPDFPWCICDAAVEKAVEIFRQHGVHVTPMHFKPSELSKVKWDDLNPNHIWLRVESDMYYDPKHNIESKVGHSPYGDESLIEEVP